MELYEWVSGGIPAFDNASFSDSDELGDLIPADLQRATHLQECSKRATDFQSNVTTGNPTRLLFVESCLQMIKDYQGVINASHGALSQKKKTILEYRCAVAALQCGHFAALNNVVTKYSAPDKLYKNKLWAIFRTAATQTRLNRHLEEVRNSELAPVNEQQALDDFHSQFTEIFDAEDCKAL